MMSCEVPLIGDFHYNGHQLLQQVPDCAADPGQVPDQPGQCRVSGVNVTTSSPPSSNWRIGARQTGSDRRQLGQPGCQLAGPPDGRKRGPRRTGGRGSVMREALIRSALDSAQQAEELGLAHDRIILSCKVSDVQDLIAVYRSLAARCDYPLHLGLTEAGMGSKGIVSSTAAMAVLLQEGYRRHDPDFADTRTGPAAHRRSRGGAGTAAEHGSACFFADGDRVPRLRPHHQHLLPVARAGRPALRAGTHAGSGSCSMTALKTCRWRSWAVSSTAPEKAVMPTSASACPVPAKRRLLRCLSTARKRRLCAAMA